MIDTLTRLGLTTRDLIISKEPLIFIIYCFFYRVVAMSIDESQSVCLQTTVVHDTAYSIVQYYVIMYYVQYVQYCNLQRRIESVDDIYVVLYLYACILVQLNKLYWQIL